MKKIITYLDAQKFVGDIFTAPDKFSVFDYANAYVLADKFYKMAAEETDKAKKQANLEIWMTAKEYLSILLKEKEEFSRNEAVKICQQVIEAVDAENSQAISKLLYLSCAYLDISYRETALLEHFWVCMYNGCAIVFGLDDYQPGSNFLSTREEVQEHKEYLKALLKETSDQSEVDALLDSIIELDKVVGNFSPT